VTEPADAAVARGDALIDAGRAPEAVTIAQQGLASDPDHFGLLHVLTRAQLDVDPPAARRSAMRLVALRPDAAVGYLLGSIAALVDGDRPAAAALARNAIEKAPNSAEAHAHLAQALANDKKRRREAKTAAMRALELNPHSTLTQIAAGNVELGAGRKKRAGQHYRQALELNPTNTIARTNLALVSRAQANTGAALGGLQSALSLDPQDPQARRVLDRIFHSTIIDLQWLVIGLAALFLIFRG
jgi:tetratricopeptide (TPR) repeat protein